MRVRHERRGGAIRPALTEKTGRRSALPATGEKPSLETAPTTQGNVFMPMTFKSQTLSVSIDCDPGKVYGFVADPENLPKWATGFCKSVRRSNAGWIAETPQGPMQVRFAARNELGVLDQYLTPSAGAEVYAPMRVLPNGAGSTVIFTLFCLPDMSDEKYAEDTGLIARDLRILKNILER